MLTRIEIDGFKTFRDFAMDIPPLLALVGPNAAGKSNLLEAIELLSNLAEFSVPEAFSKARGNPQEQFHRHPDGSYENVMTFAVEVLLPTDLVDRWGATLRVDHTRVRYELKIGIRGEGEMPGLYVRREAAFPIFREFDTWPRLNHVSSGFDRSYLRYKRSAVLASLAEVRDSGWLLFEGRSHSDHLGSVEIPVRLVRATALSSMVDVRRGPLYALRAELRAWRLLRPEWAALVRPDPIGAPDVLTRDGGHLASALNRIERQTAGADGTRGAMADIAAQLARLVPGLTGVDIAQDPTSKDLDVMLTVRGEAPVRARLASEGTLRILVLLAALHDPDAAGLLCVEEPENGIHPENLRTLVRVLASLVTDPSEQEDGPLTQLLFTSHSPVVVAALPPRNVSFLDVVDRIRGGRSERVSRVRRLADPEFADAEPAIGSVVVRAEVDQYLGTASSEY